METIVDLPGPGGGGEAIVLPVYASAVPASDADPVVSARRAAVGRRMRELRNQAGLTQEAVAEAAGLTRQFYLAVEAGQRTLSLDHVFAIADALGAGPRDFFANLPASEQTPNPDEGARR
jgi:DNA-binding XRE family transcriptional regulator